MESSFYHFAMLVFLSLCTSTVAVQQLNDDILGLIVFKADLIDPLDALRSWTEDDYSPCNWTGIVCNALTGRVTTIQLHGLSLSGHIGRGLGKLQYLQTLSLAHNNISGALDASLTQLTALRKIDLSHNRLGGPITPSFGKLVSLKSVEFSSNELSGSIPMELFSNCRSMRYLSLARNQLGGAIPDSIGSCTALRTLNLSSNQLNNAMPASMSSLTRLSVLDVSYNTLSSIFPSFLPSLLSLADVRLQSNRFYGAIAEQIGNCVLLEHMDLSNNLLSSGLPNSMVRLRSLISLNIANNSLSGGIPSWIGNMRSLQALDLSYNAFDWEFPQTIGLLASLQNADLSHNRFTGPISGSLANCSTLKSLDLSSNNLTDAIPDGLLLLPSLTALRLSNNQLTGQLPSSFYSQCGPLQLLDLSQNRLEGSVPSISTCPNVVYLNISSNTFSGSLPSFLNASSMKMSDLSHNQLEGSIPRSVGAATKLSVLLLDYNQLGGVIPSELGSCTDLTDINLSQNNLIGSIPPELGNLTSLQILDLSYNNISGTIPAVLGGLQSLAVFNLSYNQLEGPIPGNGIFPRFNESAYRGNDHLCGMDVNVSCPGVMPKPIVLNPDSNPANPIDQMPLGPSQHQHITLSASAILAICAAAAISMGVAVILILNAYAHSLPGPTTRILESLSESPSSDMPIGKLVMFTKNPDPRSEEWVSSAHALLNKDSELGRGGFGTVYKAVLADGRTVAIKKLMISSMVKSQAEFEKEIEFLGKIKHRNLLALQGYYWTPQLQLLIYDFIPNGNLYSRLHEKSRAQTPLSWPIRFKIALGAARGLAHLHHACVPQVIHYNMKSSNVLLDESLNPKIADHGLAKLLPTLDKYLMSSKFQSALGYMAPEFSSRSLRISEKCDVYGFGVTLLELVTGRRPVEYMEDDVVILCDYVRSLLDEGRAMSCIDPEMLDYVEDEALPVIKLGLICTSQVPANRPSMSEVVQILELIKTPASSRDLL